jgi:spore germination protein
LIHSFRTGKWPVFAVLCLSLLLSPLHVWAANFSLPFNDISRSYAKDAIVRLYQQHLIDGVGNRRFAPAKVVTRAEYITMLDRLFGIEPIVSAIPTFTDVSPQDWFYRWVQPSVQLGLAHGTSSATFEPNRGVTRQDAAVLLGAALKLSGDGDSSSAEVVYQDQSQISASALPVVLQLKKLAVMQGDGSKFRPAATVTRQEAAALMDRVLQHNGWAVQIRSKPAAKIQLGWQYGSTTTQFEQQVTQSDVNTLSPRWFFLNKSGTTQSTVDPSLVTWAHEHGKKVWAMAGNRSNDTLTHQILSDAGLRKSTITSLLAEVRKYRIDGVNVDFENVSPQDQEGLTAFIAELGQALHETGAVLSINVSPDLGTDWTKAFDYSALGDSADYMVLMGYDEHWGGSSVAGSVSSLPWLRNGLDSLLTHVPARKVILAMPLYTRDWATAEDGVVKSEDWDLVKQNETVSSLPLLPTWNPELGQYVFVYQKSTATHQLWLEDGRSLSAKMWLGEEKNVAGYAYWYMGGESPDIWISLRNLMRFSSYRF